MFHGTADATVHPGNGAAIIRGLRGATAPAGTVTHGQDSAGRRWDRLCETGPDGRSMRELWTVHGLGHAWSKGDPAGSYTDPAGPDASAEMVRFFLA